MNKEKLYRVYNKKKELQYFIKSESRAEVVFVYVLRRLGWRKGDCIIERRSFLWLKIHNLIVKIKKFIKG